MAAILVSACLLGHRCRYDGKVPAHLPCLAGKGEVVPFCPEVAGGLPTPRPPAEIVGGEGKDVLDGRARVVTNTGTDVTKEFLTGAEGALSLCRQRGIKKALLKSRSPSCSATLIYDGTYSGRLRRGEGVTAALLRRAGIEVEDW